MTDRPNMDELERLWRGQIEELALTDARPLHKTDPKNWTYNNAPQYAPDGSMITLRYGMKDIYTPMKIDPTPGRAAPTTMSRMAKRKPGMALPTTTAPDVQTSNREPSRTALRMR